MSIWLIPEGSDETGEAADGDLLARFEGEELQMGRVVHDSVEWLGAAPVETIQLPDVDRPTRAPDDLVQELETFAQALATMGG